MRYFRFHTMLAALATAADPTNHPNPTLATKVKRHINWPNRRPTINYKPRAK